MPNARTAAGPQVLVPSLHRQWRANEVHFGNGLSLAGRPIAARRRQWLIVDRRASRLSRKETAPSRWQAGQEGSALIGTARRR